MHPKPSQQPIGSSREVDEILTFIFGSTISIMTWVLYFGWNYHLMIPGHDALAFDLAYITELAKGQGDWRSILYRTSWMGGMKMYEVGGLSWCLSTLIRLGFSPYQAINGFIFFIQSVYAYFGIKTVSSLLTLWNGRVVTLQWRIKLPMVWIFAFAPVLGWRVCYGHSTIAMASQFFISILAGLISAMAGTTTIFLTLISTLTAYTCFQSTMAQPILYSIVFGAPVLLGLAWPLIRKDLNRHIQLQNPRFNQTLTKWFTILCKTFLPIISGFLLALDSFSLFLAQSVSGDSARSLKSSSVIYSYLTGQLEDWIGSIFWTLDSLRSNFPDFARHEVNYSMGPLLLVFFFLFPWKKWWQAALSLGFSLFLIIGFSDHVEIISGPLIAIFPPLNYFRVPTRAALIIALTLPIYALASLLNSFISPSEKTWRQTLIELSVCIATLGLLVYLNPIQREILLWIGLLALIASYRIFRKWTVSPWFLIMILGAGSVLAFEERSLQFSNAEALIASSDKVHDQIIFRAPELSSPTSRAFVNFISPIFDSNIAMNLRISAISGYGFPLQRYLHLVEEFNGVPYEPTAANLNFQLNLPKFLPLRMLYNIKYDLNLTPTQEVSVTATTATLGPAWFVDSLAPVNGFDALVKKLRDSLEFKSTGYLIQDDSAIGAELLKWPSQPICKNSKVLNLSTDLGGQVFDFHLLSDADCPLVVSTNYSSQWAAYSVDNDVRNRLKVFPINGALTGIMIPGKTQHMILRVETSIPIWAQIGRILGVLILGLMLYHLGFNEFRHKRLNSQRA